MKLSIDAAKDFCKEFKIKNLDIRAENSIRAVIRVNKQLYRILIHDVDSSKKGLLKASEKTEELKQLAKYNPEEFFLLASRTQRNSDRLFGEYIETFLDIKRHKLASCTYKNYVRKIKKHITPKFKNFCVTQLKPLDIEKWVAIDLAYLSDKTVKELLSLLTQIINIAQLDGAIDKNPIEPLKASKVLKLRASLSQPDPFSQSEINQIAVTDTPRKSEQNMMLFNCYSGLRLS
ncbi:MAG: N-terminal phage integrase SAM-like domain-containing protein, partial [Paraglaciecola sp.]|nr:N-terminal phage integrase SAM-like domain-containing protein [Paraglaciecola sp.]